MKLRLKTRGSIRQIAFANAFETERVCNLLSEKGIDCIGQLCLQTKKDLRSIEKIGDATIKVIENALNESGLRLGMSIDDLVEYEDRTYNYSPEFTTMDELMRFVEMRNRLFPTRPINVRDYSIDNDDDEEDYDDDKETVPVKIELTVNHVEEKSAEPDWDARFYEIAKEEFFRQCRMTTCDETRAERAVLAAKTFIEALKNADKDTNQTKQ